MNQNAAQSSGALGDLQYPPRCPGDGSYYVVTSKGLDRKDGFEIICGDPTHYFIWDDGTFRELF